MAEEEIRVGLIGAGGNVRNRHIPGFRKVEGVQLMGVVNRSRESSHRIAEQFNIPRIYDNWQELLDDETINAVCIGTWPYMHRPLTLAALEKGKHVLTEARMASTAQVFLDVLEEWRVEPHIGNRFTPSSTRFNVARNLQRLIGKGSLGE